MSMPYETEFELWCDKGCVGLNDSQLGTSGSHSHGQPSKLNHLHQAILAEIRSQAKSTRIIMIAYRQP